LQREEADIAQEEQERQRLLASGRVGRTSLLTGGFRGPGKKAVQSSASVRAGERATQRVAASANRKTAKAKAAQVSSIGAKGGGISAAKASGGSSDSGGFFGGGKEGS